MLLVYKLLRNKPTPKSIDVNFSLRPGKVCAFCNLGERSQLGQGQMLRLSCPDGFIPQRIVPEITDLMHVSEQNLDRGALEVGGGDKSPRGGPVTCRRQKSFSKCRNPSLASEYIDELTIIGYVDEPDVRSFFEPGTGYFYVHKNCTMWSTGITRTGTYASHKMYLFHTYLIINIFCAY